MKKLKSYRFSDAELNKMLWLKELFQENGFTIDRFPEVYYDDFNKVYPEKEHNSFPNEGPVDPDMLGVYRFGLEKDCIGKPCRKSTEGIIILFKDRIEHYSSNTGTDIDSVRFVVLMHELGHWLSHWPIRENYNWRIGFHLSNTHTHEALAQLIAYWVCQHTLHFHTLLKLTPKAHLDPDMIYMLDGRLTLPDGTVVNPENPYGRYWEIKDKSIVEVLNKLHQLRECWMLKDGKMIEFLKSDSDNLEQWLISQGGISENDINLKLNGSDCIDNIPIKFLSLQGFESSKKGYRALRRFGVFGEWYDNNC
jgi:hypothetical protein